MPPILLFIYVYNTFMHPAHVRASHTTRVALFVCARPCLRALILSPGVLVASASAEKNALAFAIPKGDMLFFVHVTIC